MKRLLLLFSIIFCCCSGTDKEYPRIYVSDADRLSVIDKIERYEWAQTAYEKIKNRINVYADRHIDDPDWIVSRLSMYWRDGERYTQCYLKSQNWDRGEGNAPLPTVRMPGMRTWNRYYNVPLEARVPYNETGDMWGIDRTNPKREPVLIPYKESGHMIRQNNVEILTLAEQASFLYWISGDDKYARFASDIFYSWLMGTYYMNPILDPDKSIGGYGGWEAGGICGYYDYEQIHDDMAMHAAVVYDFMFDYLDSNQHPHLKEISKSLKDVASEVFKRFIDIGFVRGGKDGNWNVNGWNMMLRPIMVLDSNDSYADGKGREYYLHYLTTESTTYHDAIPEILKSYDPITGLWPESPGYAFGTISMMLEFATVLRSAGIDIIADNPIMQRAAMAAFAWMDDQANMIVFGDSRGGAADFETFENLLSYYTQKGDPDGVELVSAALNRGLETGKYSRFDADWKNICTYTPSIPKVENTLGERTSYSEHHRMITMKSNDGDNKLMALLYGGKDGYHLSANGLSMQLYGFGYALAPDASGYESYWSSDFQYHQRATGCNTILPGYTQGEIIVNALEPSVAEGDFTNETCISPYVNFADVTASEKRRLVAAIRVSDSIGYYIDVFRSNQFNNDYLYHNLGNSLSFSQPSAEPLNLNRVPSLGVKYTKGYDWFSNPRKISWDGDFVAHWRVDALYPEISMYMWMFGGRGREIYQVDAPYTTLNSSITPGCVCAAPSTTPTIIVRQNGVNAWHSPFIAIFEPVKGDNRSIISTRSIEDDPTFKLFEVCFVENRKDYIFNSIDTSTTQLSGDRLFQGNLGVARFKYNDVEMLYLGAGTQLIVGNYALQIAQSGYASIYKVDGEWYYSSSSDLRATIGGQEYLLSSGYNKQVMK